MDFSQAVEALLEFGGNGEKSAVASLSFARLEQVIGRFQTLREEFQLGEVKNKNESRNNDSNERIFGAIRFLKEKGIVPEKMYFFFKDENEFVLAITGKMLPECLRAFFRKDCVAERKNGFSVHLVNDGLPNEVALTLNFQKDLLLLFPSAIEGNIYDVLPQETGNFPEKWMTFKKMLTTNPTLALETDLEAISRFLGTMGIRIPPPLGSIRTFRLMLASHLVKAQIFTPNEDERAILMQGTKSAVESIKSFFLESALDLSSDASGTSSIASFFKSLKTFPFGNSIFVEGAGLEENHSWVQTMEIGIIASFFLTSL